MSSASDKYVFEESIDQQDNSVLFQDKKWTYITDSQNGNYNGQIQFDLNNVHDIIICNALGVVT